jgi:hypothetical protein
MPAEQSQKEADVVLLLIDLIEIHHFFQYEIVRLGKGPNCLTVQQRIDRV